ncbi:MAG: amidohydrolase [Acidobacteriaceae bacterium]|nr:amidohydrolase [Acidobacteriaceae bacterium]MBV9779754.1 amidohydrolase [Acidobacteriaceae bacterium]
MRLFYSALFLLAPLISHLKAAEPADWIIRAKYVITMDPHHRVIDHGAVAIRGMRIAGVGTQSEIAQRFQARQILDKSDAVLLPGFIDTHTHAPMSLFRAIADDMRLEDWLKNFIFPAESKNVSPEFVRWGTRLACLEMVLAGITTYTDMYYFEDVEAETAKEAGLRGVLGQTIIGFPAPDYKNWRETLAATERFIERFRADDLIVPAVAPHSIYTTPDQALVTSHDLARKYNTPLLIHLAETKVERDDALAQREMTPVQTVEKLGLLEGRVVAAHSIWVDHSDIEILKRHGTGVAHCPSSNTKMAAGIAPVAEMLKAGVKVGLGTDGFAGSNDSADLMLEMNLAAKLQKVNAGDPRVLPAEQALEMATLGGARVVGLEKEIGSLEEGKCADVIAISLARPNDVPLYNLYSQIVYASKAPDVEDVFINGRQIVSERHVLTLNQDEIYRKAEEYKQRIQTTLVH